MAKKKSSRKPPPKKAQLQPLDKQFNCPFCNHEKSCDVKINHQMKTGFIKCRVCLEAFQTNVNDLSEALDVYNEWIDACEEEN